MALEIKDITRDEQGNLRLNAQELKALCELGITVSDTETTGLRAGLQGLTEFASIRAVKAKGTKPPYRLELLHHFVLPLRPEYQDYLEACSEAEENGEPLPPYDRERYEYAIAPQAMAVTGTEFIREKPDGPITGMKVRGELVDAVPFYELWRNMQAPIDISRFIRHGEQDVYYNTPFDKPFLRELIKDMEAYQLASSNAHTYDAEGDADETSEEPDPIYQQLYDDEKTSHLTDIEYDEANEIERAHIVAAIRSKLHTGNAMENSAHFQCLLHDYMKAAGADGPRNLDTAFRTMVDPNFKGRAEHSAIEDICMAARVACALSTRFGKTIPSMVDLFEQMVRRVDPDAMVCVAPARGEGDTLIEGDIDIRFSKPIEQLSPQAQRLWRFLSAFEDVTRRNSRAPHHLTEIQPADAHLVISAERKSPLSLSMLKKWMFFDQLETSPHIEGFYPHDSTGTRMDVQLRQTDMAGHPIIVEDINLTSLRANLKWLHANPSLIRSTLDVLREMQAADERIGTVLIRGTQAEGFRLIIKGHQREFGDVVLHLPKGQTPEDCRAHILEQLGPLIKLGIIPYASSLENVEQDEPEDEPAEAPETPYASKSSLVLGSRLIEVTVPQTTLQLMALELPPGTIRPEEPSQRITTRSGDSIRIEHAPKGRYRISGSIDALRDFVIPPPADATYEAVQISEKTGNVLRDASWMLYRLHQLPGTYSISIDQQGIISLNQPDGVSLETINLLYRAKLPFKAYATHIRIDASQLMRDAFYWSLHISRLQDELERDQKRPLEDQRMLPKPFLKSIQRGLFQGSISALRMDDLQQCWVRDITDGPHGQERYHLVNPRDSYHDYLCHDGRLDPLLSPIAGVQHLEETTRDGQAVIITSPVVYTVWNRWRQTHGLEPLNINIQGTSLVEIPLTDTDPQAQRESMRNVAHHIYQLYGLTGIERLPLSDIKLEGQSHLLLCTPTSTLFEHSSNLLQELIRLYGDLSSGQFDIISRQLRQHLPDSRDQSPRHANLSLLCDHIRRKTDPAAKVDGIDRIHMMSDQLTYMLSRLGGAEFAHSPESLAYGEQIEHDVGTLGFLTHELTRKAALAQPGSAEQTSLQHALQQVRTAHEKLFCFYTANERLSEACGVLRNALTGGVQGRGAHLMRTLAQAQTFLLLEHANQLSGNSFRSLGKLEEAMRPYEDSLRRLTRDANATNEEQDGELAYQSVLVQLCFATLRHISNAPAGELPRQQMLLRYLARRSGLDWSEPQLQAMVDLYRGGVDTRSLETARQQLATCFPLEAKRGQSSVEMLITQRLLQHDPYYQPPASADDPNYQATLESKISHAYGVRGLHYLRLIAPPASPADAAQTEALRNSYEAKARECLIRSGMSAEEIEKKVASHRSHVRTKPFLRAQEEVLRDVPMNDPKLDNHLAVIDLPGHADRVRELYMERSNQLDSRDLKRIRQQLDDPHARFKHTKSMLHAIHTAQEELHDLRMVRYHALRDLAATITLLFQIPELREAIPERMAGSIQSILNSVQATPEQYGLHHDTMHAIYEAHREVLSTATRHCMDRLTQMRIAHQSPQEGQIRISIDELVQAIDHVSLPVAEAKPEADTATAQPTTTLPAIKPLPRQRYAEIIHYSAHLLMQLDRDDLNFQISVSGKKAQARCQLSITPAADDIIADLLRELPQTAFGEGCETTERNGAVSVSIPIDKLACVSTLLRMAHKLQHTPGLSQAQLMPSGLGIEAVITLPKGTGARDKIEGHIQDATFCLAATRKPPLEELMKGPAGTTKQVQITLDPTLLAHQIPRTQHAEREHGLLAKAARIGAKMIGVPAAMRDRFVQGVIKPGKRDALKDLAEKAPDVAQEIEALWAPHVQPRNGKKGNQR